jgi:hypothetical protein
VVWVGATDLKPWEGIGGTAKVGVQLVLLKKGGPLLFVGSGGCVLPRRKAGSHWNLQNEAESSE